MAAGLLAISTIGAATAAGHSSNGNVTFGEGFKGGRLVNVTTQIPKGKAVAWLAHVSKVPAGKLTLRLTQTKGPGPHPMVIGRWTVKLTKPATVLSGLWTSKKLKSMKLAASTFELTYLRGSKQLASGSWKRLDCNNCSSGGGTY